MGHARIIISSDLLFYIWMVSRNVALHVWPQVASLIIHLCQLTQSLTVVLLIAEEIVHGRHKASRYDCLDRLGHRVSTRNSIVNFSKSNII